MGYVVRVVVAILLCGPLTQAAAQQYSPFEDGLTARIDLTKAKASYKAFIDSSPNNIDAHMKPMIALTEMWPDFVRRAPVVLVYLPITQGVPVVRVDLDSPKAIAHLPEKPSAESKIGKVFVMRRGKTALVSASLASLTAIGDKLDFRKLPKEDVEAMRGAMAAVVIHGRNGRMIRWTATPSSCELLLTTPSVEAAQKMNSDFGAPMIEENKAQGIDTTLGIKGTNVVIQMKGNGFTCMSMVFTMSIPIIVRAVKARRKALGTSP
ncbi:MAG: hypothetical protein ACI9OJ_005688 [Myxococcota bacterium]|jgi:hypothetical protein